MNLLAPAPSNRASTVSDFDVPWVDTVRVSGPIRDFSLDRWNEQCSPDQNGEVMTRNVWGYQPIGEFRLSLLEGGRRAAMEGSIATLRHGSNLRPASMRDMWTVLDGLLHESSTYVAWDVRTEDLRFDRLDLDRDFFGLPSPQAIIGNLGRLPGRPATKFMGIGGQAESLVVSTTRWRATLYDKYLESGQGHHAGQPPTGPGSPGHVRFEASLRSQALRNWNLHTVSDLEKADLSQVTEYYFKRAGLDAVVGATEPLAEVLRRHEGDLEYKYAPAAIGHEVMLSMGLRPPGAPNTQRRRREAASRLGISGALNTNGVRGRLDFTARSFVPEATGSNVRTTMEQTDHQPDLTAEPATRQR